MTAFLASIAFLLAVALVAAGLLTLHRSRSENSALITTAAIVLLLGGLCGVYCSSYYFLKYYFAGELESAAPMSASMMQGPMGGAMMRDGKMRGDRSRSGQRMMQMMMQDPEMMEMMHQMMHDQGVPMLDEDMPMRDRERMHQPDDDADE